MIMGPDAATFPDWRSYVAGITDSGPASNIAPLVGHGTLRAATLGFQARPATESELERMVGAFRTAMAEGAFGCLVDSVTHPPPLPAPRSAVTCAGLS